MLEIDGVSVRFDAGSTVQAVDGVHLRVGDGEHVCILGETGSGKSVLLTAILRLLPEEAQVSGDVRFDGQSVFSMDKKRLQRLRGGQISYIPQGGGGSMNPLMTVGAQVGEPLRIHKGYSCRAALAHSVELMRRFHLGNEERLSRAYPHELSGGMRQRAMIAMGIAADACLLLADEPTKGLDGERIRLVEQAFDQLKDRALLCVTHDIHFARHVADRIVVMYAGQVIEIAPAAELMSAPLHPYVRDLLAALPENGMRCPGRPSAPAALGGCRYAAHCGEATARCAHNPPMIQCRGRSVRCWNHADGNP